MFKVLVSDVGSELPTQGKLSGNYDLLYGAIFVLLIRDEWKNTAALSDASSLIELT